MESEYRVDQPVFIEERNCSSRRDCRIFEGVITKVGRKYYTVRDAELPEKTYSFNKDTLLEYSEHEAAYRMFPSEQAIRNDRERDALYTEARSYFNAEEPALRLDQLRRIMEILEEVF